MSKLSKLRKSDDLFENSSMTFGEHLEELRKAIAKSLVWVGVGLVLGFFLANAIVRYIQTPLERTLSIHLQEREIKNLESQLGVSLDANMKDWIRLNERISEKVFIDVGELARLGFRIERDSAEMATDVSAEMKSNAPYEVSLESANLPANSAVSAPASIANEDVVSTPGNAPEPTMGSKESRNPQPQMESRALGGPTPQRLLPVHLWRSIKTNTEALSLQEPFMIWMKAAIIAGIVFGSPGIFWHIWGFIAAGLYPHERRYVYFFLPISVGLFLSGAALAFFVVFHFVIRFLLTFNESMGIGTTPRLTEYVSFALMLPLGFGVAFQLPLVMFVIERLGIIEMKWYLANWRIAVAIITVISALLTPADIISMLGLMLPLIGLYFLGIALCKWVPRGRGIGAVGYDPT